MFYDFGTAPEAIGPLYWRSSTEQTDAAKPPPLVPRSVGWLILDGIAWEDLAHLTQDLHRDLGLTQPILGRYLNRHEGESDQDHLLRVHRLLTQSLNSGLPPIISFRSFVAHRNSSGRTGADGNKASHYWEGLMGHFVTIVRVDAMEEGELGFRFRFADSTTGKLATGYAFLETGQKFAAVRGSGPRSEWLKGRPFLLVSAPSIRLKTEGRVWHERTIITLNHAVIRGSE